MGAERCVGPLLALELFLDNLHPHGRGRHLHMETGYSVIWLNKFTWRQPTSRDWILFPVTRFHIGKGKPYVSLFAPSGYEFRSTY